MMRAKVLMIEDNPHNQYLMRFLLEGAGFEVQVAGTGPAGIALARAQRFDLVLLDIQLPGMNGYEVARALRAEPGFADVPVIAVTSYAMVGDRDRAIAAGATDHIEKPIDPERFVEQVRAHLPADPAPGP